MSAAGPSSRPSSPRSPDVAGQAPLFDRDRYGDEVFFDQLTRGQTFPPHRYRVGPEHVEAYLQAVGEGHAVFRDEAAARAAGFPGALVPSPALLSYGFVYEAMGCRPPTGFLNTRVSFEFLAPVRVGSTVTLSVSVDDTFVKREKKYVVLRAAVSDDQDRTVAAARIECIFPA